MNDRDPGFLKHPFWQAVLILLGSFILFKWGIALLPRLFGASSAPAPSSVVWQYLLTALVGVLLYVSADEERWSQFKQPIHRTLVDPERRVARTALLVVVPLLVGWFAYQQVRPSFGAPPSLRSVHPAPPNEITFRGSTLRLNGLENPLRHSGSIEEHRTRGAAIYVANCAPCHGDRLDGAGPWADAFNPLPADFTSNGTIAQLTESYVFWRVAKGAPGLPKEGAPWNSAMPAWETILTVDEIWAVIIFLYEQSGWSPRTWEEEEGQGGEH